MNRRDFLKTISATAASITLTELTGCASSFASKRKVRPNILFVMADDISCEVLSSYGGTTYKTPNLDKLAATGIRFTHCYSCPVCSPSRVKLLTGRYGFRNYKKWGHIPPEEITFGHVLGSAGYKTALAGKWQMVLQKKDPHHVTKMGFQQNSVFGWHEGPRYHGPMIYENGIPRTEPDDKYGPDLFYKFITDFMKTNRGNPFLAYYPMTLAHAISNDLPEPPPVGPNGRYQTYKELVEYMDLIIGRLVSTLEKLGLRQNTLILFTTDNGTPDEFITKVRGSKYIEEPIVSKVGDKTFIGGKGKLTDAGTHVPIIANWPGVAPAGTVCSDLIDFSDFMPTFAELAGGKLPTGVTIDGKSFAPQLQGKKGNPREWAYCQWNGKAWARTKRWKLYRSGKLFNIEKDPLEKSPILAALDTGESSAVRKKLQGALDGLRKS